MKPLAIALALLVMGFGMKTARAIDVGDKAPAFEGVDDQGHPWSSADHVGKGVLVVYFYPGRSHRWLHQAGLRLSRRYEDARRQRASKWSASAATRWPITSSSRR